MSKLKIGLFGFGCVGQGLYDVLSKSSGFRADIEKICVKQKEKQRPIDSKYFTFNRFEILDNPEINVIVELIDDAEEAYKIVKYALEKGKSVVTANKKMVATLCAQPTHGRINYSICTQLYDKKFCRKIFR